jgi:hypothetical protein
VNENEHWFVWVFTELDVTDVTTRPFEVAEGSVAEMPLGDGSGKFGVVPLIAYKWLKTIDCVGQKQDDWRK